MYLKLIHIAVECIINRSRSNALFFRDSHQLMDSNCFQKLFVFTTINPILDVPLKQGLPKIPTVLRINLNFCWNSTSMVTDTVDRISCGFLLTSVVNCY